MAMTERTTTEEFVAALGVTIRRVEPDGRCATYDRYNRIAYVCRVMCRDQGEQIMERLVERIV